MLTPTMQNSDPTLHIIQNRLFFRLFQVGNSLDRQCIKELGISPVHWSVLGALSRPQVHAGISFSELTEYLGVSRQNLNIVLNRLEREGQVQRVIDSRDRRAKNVALTIKGKKIWDDLQPRIYDFYKQALSGFNLDDLIACAHLLNKLNDGLINIKIEDQ